MWRYILKRLLIAIPLLLGISLLTFVLMRMTPGNYLDTIRMDPQFSEETIAHYEKLYQLDKPLLVQYFQWIKNILHLEFGYSFHYNIPVAKIIGSAAASVGVPSGLTSAANSASRCAGVTGAPSEGIVTPVSCWNASSDRRSWSGRIWPKRSPALKPTSGRSPPCGMSAPPSRRASASW